MESSAIRDLLDVIERPGVISLAGGVPAAETFPLAAVRAVLGQVLDDPGALQYSATEGFGPLRAWLAERASVELDRVVVVHGSQQGLDLVARALLDPGDDVVLADPGYVGAIQAFRLAGGHLVGVPSDRDGLCVDDLRSRLASGLRPVTRLRHRQLRQPDRSDALARTARRARGPRGSLRVHDRRGRSLWRASMVGPVVTVARCLHGSGRAPRDHVEDPLPRDARRPRGGAEADRGRARAPQAVRRPAHVDVGPARRARTPDDARLPPRSGRARSGPLPKTSAGRSSTRSNTTSPTGSASPPPMVACSSGVRSPLRGHCGRCSHAPSRPVWRSFPAPRSPSKPTSREPCGCASRPPRPPTCVKGLVASLLWFARTFFESRRCRLAGVRSPVVEGVAGTRGAGAQYCGPRSAGGSAVVGRGGDVSDGFSCIAWRRHERIAQSYEAPAPLVQHHRPGSSHGRPRRLASCDLIRRIGRHHATNRAVEPHRDRDGPERRPELERVDGQRSRHRLHPRTMPGERLRVVHPDRDADHPTYSDDGLAPGLYSYRVRAIDAAGNVSAYSNLAPVSRSRRGASYRSDQPHCDAGRVDDQSELDRIDGQRRRLRVPDRALPGSRLHLLHADRGADETTSYSDTGLNVGSYSYEVRGPRRRRATGAYSNPVSASITDATPPTAPSNLTAATTGSNEAT